MLREPRHLFRFTERVKLCGSARARTDTRGIYARDARLSRFANVRVLQLRRCGSLAAETYVDEDHDDDVDDDVDGADASRRSSRRTPGGDAIPPWEGLAMALREQGAEVS